MSILLFVLFNMIVYSFIGWVIENLYSLFKRGHIQKEGFMVGPYKPMYGIAMTLLILLDSMNNLDRKFMILLYFIIPVLVEYISGFLLDKLFHKSYWSYSHLKYQYQGIICVQFACYWAILAFLAVTYLEPFIIVFYERNQTFWNVTVSIVATIMLFDLLFTIRKMGKLQIKI